MKSRALAGIRVLDLSRLLPGPFATLQLARLGAEVIKIEDPKTGDPARLYSGSDPNAGLFGALNRGKKSVALDLRDAADRDRFLRLAKTADIVVETFRPGRMKEWGLDAAALRREHPELIYAALTGFGRNGPEAERPGHDLNFVTRSGTFGRDKAQTPLPLQVADFSGAWVLVSAMMAALFARERTGLGEFVDVSLLESMLSLQSVEFGAGPGLNELLDGTRPCYGIYPTKDGGYLSVALLEPKFWLAFVGSLGLDDLSGEAFVSGDEALQVRRRIEAVLATKTRDEWVREFKTQEVCVEPLLGLEELGKDPQLVARGAITGAYIESPLAMTFGAWDLGSAPVLGEHTDEVLSAIQASSGAGE